MKEWRIEIHPVGHTVNAAPTRYDILGVDQSGKRYFLGYKMSVIDAESHANSIREFAGACIKWALMHERSQTEK